MKPITGLTRKRAKAGMTIPAAPRMTSASESGVLWKPAAMAPYDGCGAKVSRGVGLRPRRGRRSAEEVNGFVDMADGGREGVVDMDGDPGAAKPVEEIAVLAGDLLAMPLLLEQRQERLARRLSRRPQPIEHPHVDEAQAQAERLHLLKRRRIRARLEQLS